MIHTLTLLYLQIIFLQSTHQQTGIRRTWILPFFASVAGEAIPALTSHLVQYSGRRQDQRLAVGDPGVVVYSQSIATAASVFARHIFTRRIADDKRVTFEQFLDFVSIAHQQIGHLVLRPIS